MQMRKPLLVMQLCLECLYLSGRKSRQRIEAIVDRVTAHSIILWPQQRSRFGSAFPILAAKKSKQLVYLFTTSQMLREKIGWVYLAPDLLHGDRARPALLLEP